MYRSILVPLDGSAFGEHALPLAVSLAAKSDAVLHLAHVHQVVPPATLSGVAILDTIDVHLRQDEQAYLADVGRRLTEVRPTKLVPHLLDGDAVPTLCEFAAAKDVDLVVMSTHGRGAMGRFWLGSIADECVRKMPRPVLLVRPPEGKPDLKRLPQFKSILIPLDGTPLAEQVIDPAVALGQHFGAEYTLVRVNLPVLRPTYLPEGSGMFGITHGVLENITLLQRQALEESTHYLRGVAEKLKARGLRVNTRVLVDEEPAVALLAEAQARGADLIAMETHARRGLSRLINGSIADRIVRAATMPVLLNRPAV